MSRVATYGWIVDVDHLYACPHDDSPISEGRCVQCGRSPDAGATTIEYLNAETGAWEAL